MTAKTSINALLLSLALVVALPAFSGSKTPVAPGTYKGWGPDIDSIEIVKTIDFAKYQKIVVVPLDVTNVEEKGDADLAAKVDAVLRIATKPFLEGLSKNIERGVEVSEGTDAKAPRTLIVRAKVTTLDPGSRAKRMWVGYGAGAARAAVKGEIVDAQTGEVLVRFTQERRSGMERFGKGSSYEEIMKRNLAAIGKDVAKLLEVF